MKVYCLATPNGALVLASIVLAGLLSATRAAENYDSTSATSYKQKNALRGLTYPTAPVPAHPAPAPVPPPMAVDNCDQQASLNACPGAAYAVYWAKTKSKTAWESSPGFGHCMYISSSYTVPGYSGQITKVDGDHFFQTTSSFTNTEQQQKFQFQAGKQCYIIDAGHKAGENCYSANHPASCQEIEFFSQPVPGDPTKRQDISHGEVIFGCCTAPAPIPAPTPKPVPAPAPKPLPAPVPVPTGDCSVCPYAIDSFVTAGQCGILQLGASKVTMSHGDATGAFGTVCMATGSTLSRSGGQIVKGDLLVDGPANIPQDASSWTHGIVNLNADLSTQINEAYALRDQIEAMPCDVSDIVVV
jgi:hypothetical protein